MNPPRGDTIFLRGLEVECIVGVNEWERRVRQRVVIDLELPVDCARAAAQDDIADTLDYGRVAETVKDAVGASSYRLVETMAERTASLLLREFGVDWVRIHIEKPGAVRGARAVGIAIERRREGPAAAGG
ncbi:MAG: dihydroneopterin aldolase [Gammaproteobacteria bacterium]|nr:dihydroneopterin aldolase [Gammaproteobacteria bacterium]